MTFALQKLLSTDGKPAHFLAVDIDGDLVQRALEKESSEICGGGEIAFRRLDITDADGQATCLEYAKKSRGDHPRYDVAFCLSVTMWIHLNHGDDGLDRFLRFVASACDRLLVEPQPWTCYTKAARRLRRAGGDHSFERLDGLRVRGAGVVEKHIDRVLTSDDCGLVRCDTFGLTPWKRSIVLYKRPSV